MSSRLLNDLLEKNKIHRGGIYQSVAHCGVSVGLLTLPVAVVITIPTSSERSREAMDYRCRTMNVDCSHANQPRQRVFFVLVSVLWGQRYLDVMPIPPQEWLIHLHLGRSQ